MGIVEEETDEPVCGIELLVETRIMEYKKLELFVKDANELLSVIVTSIKTAWKTKENPQSTI